MGTSDEQTANFFAQNAKNNQHDLWSKFEMCLSVCLQTVLAFEKEANGTGGHGHIAEFYWALTYPGTASLYPSSVTYKYDFFTTDSEGDRTSVKCWDDNAAGAPGTSDGTYYFDDALGRKAWDNWAAMKTTGKKACNTVRGHADSAMRANTGNMKFDNKCDAPCGPGSSFGSC